METPKELLPSSFTVAQGQDARRHRDVSSILTSTGSCSWINVVLVRQMTHRLGWFNEKPVYLLQEGPNRMGAWRKIPPGILWKTSKKYVRRKGATFLVYLELVIASLQLRASLKIEKFHVVFGGSWGSSLSLAYAISHPQRVRSLVLRGIFLFDHDSMNWLFNVSLYFTTTMFKLLL